MMGRRAFIVSALGLCAVPLVASAQHAGKVARIGVLGGGRLQNVDAFFQRLRDLGWVEGKDVVIERRNAEGRSEQLSALAVELVHLNVGVILAAGGPASLNAARAATKTIPIVMVASSRDPIGGGFIESYARPGGNITGLTSAPEDLTGKQLEYLKEVVPGLLRVGLLWDTTVGAFRLPRETAETARLLAVEVVSFEVREPSDFGHAVTVATRAQVGGLIFAGSPMFVRNRKQLADLLTKHRLPAISIWSSFPEAGVLMAYGPSLRDLFGRAAVYVDKILKGANPADLPVERPTKFDLVINLKTAKALGLTIPQSVLVRADEVIQ
jgi:putative ABC transport system substrate-binding protein